MVNPVVSGYVIVAVLGLLCAHLYRKATRNKRGEILTISHFGSNRASAIIIVVAASLIALLNATFLYGLDLRFGVATNGIVVLFGLMTSVYLVFTGMTASHHEWLLHRMLAVSFFMSFIAYEGFMSLAVYRSMSLFGMAAMSLVVLSVASSITMLIHYKFRLNGVLELTLMLISSIWILIVTTAALL